MKWRTAFIFVLLFLGMRQTVQQNATSTSSRRSGHRDSNVLNALQHIQQQLNGLDTDEQTQTSRIQEIIRIATRMEAQRQEIISTMDRSEARLSQRLDDIKGDIRKVLTLQEVMREDMDKVQQTQLLNKVWIEEQLRHINIRHSSDRIDSSIDTTLAQLSKTDILANLQILQTTLYSLRRMADTLQTGLNDVKLNITNLANITKMMLNYEKETSVTKSYLQSSLQALTAEKEAHIQYTGCVNPMQNEDSDEKLPKDCQEVQNFVQNVSGIYRIQPKYANRPIFVYCDMETEGGGWTVIQRRKDGSIDFLREWNDYKHGFGNVGGEFWLGNENLYLITHQGLYELRVDLRDFEEGHAFSKYDGFAVGSEKEKYMLKLLGPLSASNAGDGLTYHASMPFSTPDMDNDRWEGGNCAKDHTGGWWYNQCDASNLNGQYLRGLSQQEYQGVYWHEWQGPSYSLMTTQMMIRPMKHMFTTYAKSSNETEITEDVTIQGTTTPYLDDN